MAGSGKGGKNKPVVERIDMTITSHRPAKDEYAEFYETYVRLVPDADLRDILSQQMDVIQAELNPIDEPTASMIHPPYTWTIKQVVGHLIDCERVFADRLHRFACGDEQPLPGIDQDRYVANQDFETVGLAELTTELLHLRQANLLLLRRIPDEAWDRRGTASDVSFTVRSLACIMAGHIIHHIKIIKSRVA